MREASVKGYDRRIARVLDYIDVHMDDPINVETLSEVANFSKFHFHREFSRYVGVGVMSYVRMLRLKRASYRLAFHKHERIIDIALDSGFGNPQSFARAFKQAYGQTPSQFRKKPQWDLWNQKMHIYKGKRRMDVDVTVTEFKGAKIAKLTHLGPMELVNETVAEFVEWRKQSGLSPLPSSDSFGIPYADPESVSPQDFRFDICGAVKHEIPEDNAQGVVNGTIPAGRCAVVRHVGAHDEIGRIVRYLYKVWLAKSDEKLGNFPVFFHYLNIFPEVAEHELVTDIYLPLA